MTNSTHLYGQLFGFLRQYSRASDLRHLKALAWMVNALILSRQLSLPAWEPYVRYIMIDSTRCRVECGRIDRPTVALSSIGTRSTVLGF
jgi:hypothetical protein